LKGENEQAGERNPDYESDPGPSRRPPSVLTAPWSVTVFAEVKGILHSPSSTPTVNPEGRDMLLTAIAKARAWIDDLVEGRVASFAEIARKEGKVERHVRFLAPLAFVSPRIISEIIDGAALPTPTVTGLAQGLADFWAKQERHRYSGS
jgi:site-specific DNA recombinase